MLHTKEWLDHIADEYQLKWDDRSKLDIICKFMDECMPSDIQQWFRKTAEDQAKQEFRNADTDPPSSMDKETDRW